MLLVISKYIWKESSINHHEERRFKVDNTENA